MLGLALLGIGSVLLWAAFTKRGDAVLAALNVDLPSAITYTPPTIQSSNGGGESSTIHAANQTDSGSHMGLDSSGNVVTIDKTYGDMSDAEKDAANAYAHAIGNFGSSG